MNREFSEILAEVREQVLYLQELGVDGCEAELPAFDDARFEISNVNAPAAARPAPEIPHARLEKFVPALDELKPKADAAQAPTAEPRPSRGGLLEATKLSRISSMPKRNLYNQTDQGEKPTMPKQKSVEKAEELSDTLFGDISQSLPETSETVEDIRAEVGNCTRCPLHEGRTKIVHSTGNLNAELMFVGEAPGADEDARGEPFVGRAGQLLNKIIEAIGLGREDVFIGNINRCRPPGNRTPTLPEAHTCRPFLIREIAVVRPKVIVVLGNTACQNLLDTKVGITKLRGNFQDYYGVKVMPTFHPAYLLRDPSKKRETWEDMKKVRDYLNSIK